MTELVLDNINKQTESGRRGKRDIVSNLIIILWITSIAFSMIAYSMSESVMTEGKLGHLRSYLLSYSNVMLIYLISFLAGFALSALIFYAIARSGSKFKLYLLGGIFFLVSGIFDLLSSYYVYELRNKMIDLAMRVPIISFDEVQRFINSLNTDFASKIMFLNTWSIVSIGLAFIFFGLNSIFTVRLIRSQFIEQVTGLQEAEGEAGGLVIRSGYTSERNFESALSDIKNGGILYLLSGILDAMVLVPGFESFTTYGFILFLVGLYFERRGFKKLQESGASLPPSFSDIFG